jgi:hypothetical protein
MGNDGIQKLVFSLFALAAGGAAIVITLFPDPKMYGGFVFGEGVFLINLVLIGLIVKRLFGAGGQGRPGLMVLLGSSKLLFIGLSVYIGLEVLRVSPWFLLGGAGFCLLATSLMVAYVYLGVPKSTELAK